MLSKLLIATNNSDFSESIFKFGIDFASTFSADITSVFIINQILQNDIFYSMSEIELNEVIPPFFPTSELYKKIEQDGLNFLNRIDYLKSSNNLIIEKKVLYGFVDEIIYEESKLHDLTIIGKYSHGQRKILGFLGSNTERIMTMVEKPLLIVPMNYHEIKKILICYDGSQSAKKGLQLANEYAKRKNCELTLLLIKEKNHEINIDNILDEATKNINDKSIKINTIVEEGETSKIILSYSIPEKFDLVVMGTHGHRKIKELILGTTSCQVIRKTLCPVLLTR